jgi:molybdenum cofactor biosynthesis enzyme
MEPPFLYAFEDIPPGLPRAPMSAVRALHAAGMQVGPRGWSSLTLETRMALCIEGTRAHISGTTVGALLRGLPLEHLRLIHRMSGAEASAAPIGVASVAGPLGPRLAELWPSLTPLDRYVLRALTSNSRLFDRAAHEILGALLPGGAPWVGEVGRAELWLSVEALERLCSHSFLDGHAFLLARTAGLRAARAVPDLFDLASASSAGLIELDWRVLRDGGARVLWQAHVSTWEGVFEPLSSMMAAGTSAMAARDMVRGVDPTASVGAVMVRSEAGQVGSGLFADEATGFYGG